MTAAGDKRSRMGLAEAPEAMVIRMAVAAAAMAGPFMGSRFAAADRKGEVVHQAGVGTGLRHRDAPLRSVPDPLRNEVTGTDGRITLEEMAGFAGTTRCLVGRARERTLLLDAVHGALTGVPSAVFVHGEAGVGKTSLVRELADVVSQQDIAVLWGQCVRFGAVESTYLPLVMAIEGWLETADPHDRSCVLDGVAGARQLLPSLGGNLDTDVVRLLPVVERLVMRIASLRPTLLVVDDVQWADLASRDTLAYLVAGFRGQRITIMATYRDEELGTGHPLWGWMADMRRLPGVSEMRLPRLTLTELEQQLAITLGGDPHPGLVADVMDRSQGNPYLSALLVEGLTVETERLPEGLPGALTDALLAAWHRLSPGARRVTQILAVAGCPSSVSDLAAVASAVGVTDDLTVSLTEAIACGITVAQGDSYWFRHPLLAETLLQTLLPGEATPLHTAWAATLCGRSAAGVEEMRRLGALAVHHEAAHDVPSAVRCSMAAAALAGQL